MTVQVNLELTGILLSVIAVVALIAALRQLRTMQEDSKTQIIIATQQELATRASILLALDERFGSEAMQRARTEMGNLHDEVIAEAQQKWRAFDQPEIRRRSSDLYAEKLDQMRTADRPRYIVLLNACGFFDTVGYVTKSKYVPLGDILRLFSATVTIGGILFEGHIRKLREDSPDKTVFENFSWLIEEARKLSAVSHVAVP
jgi:hypothetical protein